MWLVGREDDDEDEDHAARFQFLCRQSTVVISAMSAADVTVSITAATASDHHMELAVQRNTVITAGPVASSPALHLTCCLIQQLPDFIIISIQPK